MFPRAVTAACLLSLTSGISQAAKIYWDGTAPTGTWNAAANWSTTTAAGGADPAAAPGAADEAIFTVSGLGASAPQTVTIVGAQPVQLITTANQQAPVTLVGTGGTSVLQLGTGGFTHAVSGLTIGSTTAGLELPISLQGSQTWTSSANANTPVAATIHSNVSIGAGGNQTLTLAGINTNPVINGNITDGAGVLSLVKGGTSANIWTLNGTANTFSGTTTVNNGILRLTNAGALNAANTTVKAVSPTSFGTVSLRVGGTIGFTAPQVDSFVTSANFEAGSGFAIDTANGSFTYDSNLSGAFNFVKLGLNTLTLTGNNTYTGTTTVNEGILTIGSTSAVPPAGADPQPIKVGANGTLVGLAGPLSDADLAALPSLAVITAGGTYGISTAAGDHTYTQPFTGTLRFQKTGANTLTLTADSTHTGGTVLSGGTLKVFSINNGGLAGGLGAAGSAGANLLLGGAGRLMYAGPATSTDRLFTFSGSFTLDSSGSGPITLANTGSNPFTGTAGARTITLSGSNQGDNRINGVLINSGTGTALTSVFKQGSGNWTLAGANTYTGPTRVNGGTLTLDYATVDPVMAASNVVVNSGDMVFKAGAVTSDTVNVLTLSANQQTSARLRLEGGFNLTATRLDGGGQSQRIDLIDLYGNAANVINVGGINTTTPHTQMVDGVLMANASTTSNGRANLVVRAPDGSYGFAALSATTSGIIQKAATGTEVTPASPNMTSVTERYLLDDPGTYTLTADAAFSTMTVNSNAGPIIIAANTRKFNPSAAGKGLLFSGSNTVTISSNANANIGAQAMWFHNYLDAAASLDITADYGTGNFLIIGGSGFTNYSGQGLAGNFFVHGSLVRVSKSYPYDPGTGEMRIMNGGVLEIGGDLTAAAGIDFNKSVRSNTGALQFIGDGGLSAYTPEAGGRRVVNFSVYTMPPGDLPYFATQPLTWGTARFLTLPESDTDGDFAFKLSSTRSNATIEIQNSINLNGRSRTVDVANGSADLDAELSGVLSGGGAAGLVKTGAGTLALTGDNTYLGETQVVAGVLRVDPGAINPSSSIRIESGGTLHVTGNVHVASVIINGVAQGSGVVTSANVTGPGTLTVDSAMTPYQQWVVENTLGATEDDADLDPDHDGLLNLLEYAVGTNPKVAGGSVLTSVPGSPHAISFPHPTSRADISIIVEASADLTPSSWSTLATSVAGGAFSAAGGSGASVSESGGQVTVTDSSTTSHRFYRLRVIFN